MEITKLNPLSGRMVKEDGGIINIADKLAGDQPAATTGKFPINSMSPMSGRMIREDGSIVNIADLIEQGLIGGGGGEGGTTDYSKLQNKPRINGVELLGNKTSADLKIAASETSEIDHGTADTTFELTPNILHKWGEVASLNLTLAAGTDGIVNNYMFSFVSGQTATQVTLPASVKGLPQIEPNSEYEISIVDNKLAYGRWDKDAQA